MKKIDFRSDTVTQPTDEMRQAMAAAEVGDDVYGDDPTMNRLQQLAAEVTGKEAALFVPSGTFGNQLAVLTHCQPRDEVLLDEESHIIQHEGGAAGLISGVQLRQIAGENGILEADELEKRIRSADDDIHLPSTRLICTENALSNGRVLPLDNMQQISRLAQKHALATHLDGARLFNAAAALGVDAATVAGYSDSVQFCLSKGLCAPVGSMLVGSRDFIELANRYRKLMGGGLRQAGILAAAGIIAIEKMSRRLPEDHQKARYLAEKLQMIDGIEVFQQQLEINMVFFSIAGYADWPADFAARMADRGVIINDQYQNIFRFVTHYWITESDIDTAVGAMRQILNR